MFLARAGCKAIQRVLMMAYPRNLEKLTFNEISEVIKRNIRPKKRLFITERTMFQETRQHLEESIVQFIRQLKERARNCKNGKAHRQERIGILLGIDSFLQQRYLSRYSELIETFAEMHKIYIEFT